MAVLFDFMRVWKGLLIHVYEVLICWGGEQENLNAMGIVPNPASVMTLECSAGIKYFKSSQ